MSLNIGANFRISAGVSGQAQVDAFTRQLREAEKAGGMLGGSMDSLRGVMARFTGAAIGTGLVLLAKSAIDNADALNEMAERTGIAGDKLSELDYAAKMNGASLDELEVALKKVSTKAVDAATGNKAAADTFNALGLSALDVNGKLKTSDVLFQEIADVLNQVEDRTLRTALAVEFFGKSGADLIPLMENMREAREEAQRLGVVVGTDMQRAADEFNDNVTKMSFLAKRFALDLANEVIPTLNRFMTELSAGREIFGGYWAALKNIGTTNPFNTPAENAKKYTDQAKALEEQIARVSSGQVRWLGKDTPEAKARVAELNTELENTKKLVEYFQRMSGQNSTAGAGRGVVNPPLVNPVDGAAILDRMRRANEKPDKAPAAARESEFDKLKRQYEDAAMRVDDLSESEKLLREIQLGRFKDLTPEQQKQLEAMARDLDYKRMLADAEKAGAARQKQASGDRERDAERAQEEQRKAIEGWEEIADPARKYREEIEKVRQAFMGGLISDVVAKANIDHLDKLIEKLGEVKDEGKDSFDDLKRAVEGWGRQATDAIVEFAFTGKMAFGDMVTSILKDLARMVIQKSIVGPLFDGLMKLLPFADGGVFGAQPFAAGDVFNTPTYFKFASGGAMKNGVLGEAGPEAIMPLRRGADGRLGVAASGAGGGVAVNVTVNVESGQTKTDGSTGRAAQLGTQIASAVRQILVDEKRPGGLLAA